MNFSRRATIGILATGLLTRSLGCATAVRPQCTGSGGEWSVGVHGATAGVEVTARRSGSQLAVTFSERNRSSCQLVRSHSRVAFVCDIHAKGRCRPSLYHGQMTCRFSCLGSSDNYTVSVGVGTRAILLNASAIKSNWCTIELRFDQPVLPSWQSGREDCVPVSIELVRTPVAGDVSARLEIKRLEFTTSAAGPERSSS